MSNDMESEEAETTETETLVLTPELIAQRHKDRVTKVMAEHGFEKTESLWDVPDELHAITLANAEDWRAHAGWTKPNRKALSLSAEEESDDVAEAETTEPEEESDDGV